MATDTTHNVGLTSSTEIVASLKNENEVLIYPKTVAQSVTVMKAGYTDGSTTQTLAERLAALDTTDESLSDSISSLSSTLTSTTEALQEDIDELADVNTSIGTVSSSQSSLETSVFTAVSSSTTQPYITLTSTPLITTPVTVSEVTVLSAVKTLAQYCHSHSTGSTSRVTAYTACTLYCSCDSDCNKD